MGHSPEKPVEIKEDGIEKINPVEEVEKISKSLAGLANQLGGLVESLKTEYEEATYRTILNARDQNSEDYVYIARRSLGDSGTPWDDEGLKRLARGTGRDSRVARKVLSDLNIPLEDNK